MVSQLVGTSVFKNRIPSLFKFDTSYLLTLFFRVFYLSPFVPLSIKWRGGMGMRFN